MHTKSHFGLFVCNLLVCASAHFPFHSVERSKFYALPFHIEKSWGLKCVWGRRTGTTIVFAMRRTSNDLSTFSAWFSVFIVFAECELRMNISSLLPFLFGICFCFFSLSTTSYRAQKYAHAVCGRWTSHEYRCMWRSKCTVHEKRMCKCKTKFCVIFYFYLLLLLLLLQFCEFVVSQEQSTLL